MTSRIAALRTVARFDDADFVPMALDGEDIERSTWKNISFDEASGRGSYLMRMEPGAVSNPHRHNGAEEFFILEGDLKDHDGHLYAQGDFVSLAAGSCHKSISPSGCLLVVTHHGPVDSIEEADL